ncbi:MAG TPA: hypothetical protein VGR35_08190 [Tepidisphaeraceae bacterium]|nr:hypothetical protein [Tepidisphaeraceae bacterium]
MIAVKARFNGKQVVLPDGFQPPPQQEVIVIFEEGKSMTLPDTDFWARASEDALRKIWDNADDEIYNKL